MNTHCDSSLFANTCLKLVLLLEEREKMGSSLLEPHKPQILKNILQNIPHKPLKDSFEQIETILRNMGTKPRRVSDESFENLKRIIQTIREILRALDDLPHEAHVGQLPLLLANIEDELAREVKTET